MVMKMKRYVLAAGLVAIVAVAAIGSAGIGIKNSGNTIGQGFKHMFGNHEKATANGNGEKMHKMHRMARMAKMQKMAKGMARNLLRMDREEGTLLYQNGTFYVDNTPLYVGDSWWLNHTIKSDYDGDGSYETIWNELNGLVGSHVVVNGIYKNGTLIVSHINGMFLRMPFVAEFITINGTLEMINGSFYIDGYRIIIPNRMAKSDYNGDGLLEKMHAELQGLVGSNVKIDGYVHNDNIRPIHINGIAI